MKKLLSFFWVLFFLLVGVGNTLAKEMITPFGELEWNDGIVDVVKKFQNIPGIEQIEITLGSEAVDVSASNTNGQIVSKLGELLEKHQPAFFNPKFVDRISYLIKTYIDINGEKKKYTLYEFTVVASPITIAGVPFKIKVTFKPSPGFAIQNPDKVLIERRANISFPLVMEDVELKSNSNLVADKYRYINKLIINKYKKFDKYSIFHEFNNGQLDGNLYDNFSHSLNITSNKDEIYIRYSNALKRLDEKYRKHLAKIEAGKVSGKKDMSSGL